MTPLLKTIFVVWIMWAAVLAALRYTYGQLAHGLELADPERWHALAFREGTTDVLEPWRWYFRLRAIVRQPSVSTEESAELAVACRRLRVLISLFEAGAALLVVLIAIASPFWPF